MDSEILKTLENTNMILAPEGLQNISGRQRNPTDIVYSKTDEKKVQAKKIKEKKWSHAIGKSNSGVLFTQNMSRQFLLLI